MHLSEYDGPVVTTFANVIPAKGLDYLVLAAEIIRERAPDIRPIFFIVGSTEVDELYYQSLQARVAEQELNVVFTGWQDDPYSFYENADIVVLPTLSEGFPRSVLEAMFCGIPVVASAVGGIPEIVVDGETGYLVPPGDANALANALLRLLRDPHLRIKFGRAGRERVQQHFSSEQMIEKIQALYLKLLASK
jgi:glycosyltransferase involved in cell wall biosynthesis